MENKLTVTALAAMIALATGKSKEICEKFLQQLFAVVAEELERGGSVRIKGFGTFKLVDVDARKSVDVSTGEDNEIPAHKRISFVAAKELADLVNSPFEAFEAVELVEDEEVLLPEEELPVTEEDVPEMEEVLPLPDASSRSDASSRFDDEVQMNDDSISQSEVRDSIETSSSDDEVQSDEIQDDEAQSDEVQSDDMQSDEEQEEGLEEPVVLALESGVPPTRRGRFGWGFLTGFLTAVAVLALVAVVWFLFVLNDPSSKKGKAETSSSEVEMGSSTLTSAENPLTASGELTKVDSIAQDSTAKVDSVANIDSTGNIDSNVNGTVQSSGSTGGDDVPTQPSDRPVYDTVSTTRYLTTMAKEHYGNFNLWPIIYEENKAILGHPDRIKPGTKVVVPPLSKYGIDPNNPEDIKRMKRKGVEIYSRYK